VKEHKTREQASDFGRDTGWSAIIKILRRYRWNMASIAGATVGVYVSSLSMPILIQHMIDGIAGGTSAWSIGWLALLALLLSIADVALADIRQSRVILLGQRVDRLISLAIMAAVLGAHIDVSNRNIGEVLNRTEQTGKIKDFLIDIIPSSIFDIGGALIAAIVIFYYDVYCGLATALIAAGGVWYSKRVLDTFYADIFAVFKLHSERQGNLAETVNGLPTIKALAMERGRFRQWGYKTKVLINAYGKTRHIIRRFFRGTRLSCERR
jgi:ABC-type bacteriocin/lantibiotic exporter with double-glycine peptidase domain